MNIDFPALVGADSIDDADVPRRAVSSVSLTTSPDALDRDGLTE
jgi:hypothetical protein